MKFLAEVCISPLKEILDPQGKAVTGSLSKMGLLGIDNVRIGKYITLEVDADSEQKAKELVDTACKKLLANLIMESYTFELRSL